MSVAELSARHVTFFVASDGAVAVGCAALAVMGRYGEVKSLFVDPAARGRGVGRQLLAHLEAVARARPLTALRLETGTDLIPARALYETCGFLICAPFGSYPDSPASIFMEKRL